MANSNKVPLLSKSSNNKIHWNTILLVGVVICFILNFIPLFNIICDGDLEKCNSTSRKYYSGFSLGMLLITIGYSLKKILGNEINIPLAILLLIGYGISVIYIQFGSHGLFWGDNTPWDKIGNIFSSEQAQQER